MPFNPEKSENKPAPSSDPELNEMLKRIEKMIEENPRTKDPYSGAYSTFEISKKANYPKKGEVKKPAKIVDKKAAIEAGVSTEEKIEDAKRKQWREMKRAGIKNAEDLPGGWLGS